jgi:hypothetical protein
MKKLLFFVGAVFSFGFASAQITYDLEMELVSPANNQAIVAGQPFVWAFQISNHGPDAIPTGDTIFFNFTMGSSTLGNYYILLATDFAANTTRNYGDTITITGGSSVSSTQLCMAITRVGGVSAGGEIDPTNWQDCNTISYNNSGVNTIDYQINTPENLSYFAGGRIFINVKGVMDAKQLTYEVMNIAGQTITSGSVRVENFTAKQEVAMPGVASGIYILRLSDGQKFNSTKKIMIQN